MKHAIVFRSAVIVLLIILFIAGAAVWALWSYPRPVLEYAVHQSAKGFLDGPLDVEKVWVDTAAKLHVAGIRGLLKTREGAVPFEVKSVESLDPLSLFFEGKTVRFIFQGVRPKGSPRPGVSGIFSFLSTKHWRFELTATLNGADLEDLRWLDPQDLSGATGAIRGKVTFVQGEDQDPLLGLQLEAPEPGGMIRARFFDIFLPYLPPSVQKERVAKLAAEDKQLVRYQIAGLDITMPQSDRMKVLLRILVLDYNLKLTLNANIRTDAKNTFSQVARLLGLIEVKS